MVNKDSSPICFELDLGSCGIGGGEKRGGRGRMLIKN